MMPFDLSTGNVGAAVSFPLDEGTWVPMPFAPWSTINGFYRKTLWVQKPDSITSQQDVFKKPGFALLKMVEFKSDATTLYSFSFNNILEDQWIVGPKKNGVGGILGMTPSELYDKRYDFVSSSSSSNSVDSELKRKLKEAEDALEEQKKKAEELQTNLDTKEQELTSTTQALVAQKRTHQTYISRKASEVKKLKQTHDESENKLLAEKEKLEAEVEAASRRLTSTLASSATSASGAVVPTFYGFINSIVSDMQKALTKKVDDINVKAQKYATSTPTVVSTKNPDEIIAFMFQDQHNQWTRVDDDVFQLLIVAYEKNCQDTVKYTAYGNSYETKLIIYANSQNQFEQVNVATKVRRVLTAVARKDEAQLLPGSTSTASTSDNDNPRDEFIRKSMDTLLFGDSHFAVNLQCEIDTLKNMLIGSVKPDSATLNHSFDETTDPFILKLSELVQLHSSMASGFKYLSPDGDKSKSALIIQPEVIIKAFKKAAEENYSNIRLVFHGSSDYTPWLTTSFSFNHSGKNGAALGQAFYMAMSDEVAAEYGMRYPRHGFPRGNMMACLSFTPKSPTRFSSMKKKIDYHQNYNDGRYDANIASRYIDVGGAIKHLEHHNALGFNDPTLVIPIGVMVPYA